MTRSSARSVRGRIGAGLRAATPGAVLRCAMQEMRQRNDRREAPFGSRKQATKSNLRRPLEPRAASRENAIGKLPEDNRAALARNGKLTLPVLAVCGEASTTGPLMSEMMREVAETVTELRAPRTGSPKRTRMPSSTASRRFSRHHDKQCQRERRKPICDDPRAALRRREISFSQGAEWNSLISTYIGTIPLSGDTSCPAEHIMSAPPLDT